MHEADHAKRMKVEERKQSGQEAAELVLSRLSDEDAQRLRALIGPQQHDWSFGTAFFVALLRGGEA